MDPGDAAPTRPSSALSTPGRDRCAPQANASSFLFLTSRKHCRQQTVAHLLEPVDRLLYLLLVLAANGVLHITQLADHLADRNLALLFVLVRLDRGIPIQFGKGNHIRQCGLPLLVFTS